MIDRPRVLIEDWLPITELGIESRREAAPIPGQFPKIKTLHIWWARRPLAASAGVLLNSLLPTWSPELADAFPGDARVANEGDYRRWALHLAGVWGDPVAAKVRIAAATEKGKTLGAAAYGYRQAFKNCPNPSNLDLLHRVLEHTWGELPAVIDPTAGGGSIPYTASRYGLPTTANDINAVAAVVLRAGVEVTSREGGSLVADLREWGGILVKRCAVRLAPFFELPDASDNNSYIFARSIACPRTGKSVPLSPSWWLSKQKGGEFAVRVLTVRDGVPLDQAEFEIVSGAEVVELDPDSGTVAGGDAVSIWDGLPIDSSYIKAEAQAGRLGSVLYAIAVRYPNPAGGRSRRTRGFRGPTETDLQSLAKADVELSRLLPGWLLSGVVPDETIPEGNDTRPQQYGMTRWIDVFSTRQLLVHGVFAEEFQRLLPEVMKSLGERRGSDVAGLLALMQGKALNFNALMATWDTSRDKIRSVFERHDFAFKWTYAEFEGGRELLPWCLDQVVDAYEGIADLYRPGHDPYVVRGERFDGRESDLRHRVPGVVHVMRGSAGDLERVASGSHTLVCVDPPYYDNVMYAELSDFFGVWEQHTVGRVWPDLMPGGLADVANEAVANPARFRSLGSAKRAKELANADYQAKMQAIFVECIRVLRDDGVMTVMFTHKRTEAWDTLGMALMEAGFEIATSWPVNTESEQSLHQAKKNAAASTVMLVCRKRSAASTSHTFFEDLVPEIKSAARAAVERFEKDGIHGVDLLLSTYGPVLSVISACWPVYSSEAAADGSARLLRPEEALNVAREELVEARRRSIVGRQVTFDPVTDFWLIAWELFQAEEFPYDEARRLALAVGGQDPESLASLGLLKKKAGTVVLQTPGDRRKRVLRPVQDGDFESLYLVDILHGVLVTADLDGLAAAKTLMDRHGLTTDQRFLGLVQGAVHAVPRTKKKGVFIRPEAATLDALATAYLPSINVPEAEPPDTLFDVD